jgi:adenylate cyclase class IV
MRNVEAKLPCGAATLESVRSRALVAGAPLVGVQLQVDTYFHAPQGRLKLREVAWDGGPREAFLIGYARPDTSGARTSDYQITPVSDPTGLTEVLTSTLGIHVRVAKRRELLWLRHTRIHLDTVERLGTFVEFETLVGASDARRGAEQGLPSITAAEQELGEIADALELDLSRGLAGSYVDLLLAAANDAGDAR